MILFSAIGIAALGTLYFAHGNPTSAASGITTTADEGRASEAVSHARPLTKDELETLTACPVAKISVDERSAEQANETSGEAQVRLRAAQIVSEDRFEQFRNLAKPYLTTVRSMLPLDHRFATNEITSEESARYWKLDATKNAQWRTVWNCIYDKQWSIEDRGAMMQWLLFESTTSR